MNWLPVSIASFVILGTSAQTTCISSAVARRWLTWLTSALLWQRPGGWQTASGWPLVARTQVRSLLGSGWSIHTWSTPLLQQAHLFTPLLTSQVREGHWAWRDTLNNSDVVQKSLVLVVFLFCFYSFFNFYIFGRSNCVEPTFSWQSILCVKASGPFGISQTACFSRLRKAEPTEEAKQSKISSVRSKSVWLEFLACCSVEIEWSNHGVRTHAPSLKSKNLQFRHVQSCLGFLEFPEEDDAVLSPVLWTNAAHLFQMFLTLSNKNIFAKWCGALDYEIAGRDCSNVSERGSLRRFKEEEGGITLYRRLCCFWLRALLCSGKLCAGLWVRGALYADLNWSIHVDLQSWKPNETWIWILSTKSLVYIIF